MSGEVRVNYNGTGTDPAHHFTPGESLTVTLAPASGVSASAGTVPNVPATWGASNSDSFSIPISTTVPAATSDGTYAVDVTVTGDNSGYTAGDGSGSPGKPKYQVIVNCGASAPANVAPSIAFSSPPSSATEGDVKTFNFAITDPDAGQTYSYAAGSPDCGTLGSVSGTPSIDSSAKTGSFSCSFPDGLVPATPSSVSVQVSDGVDLSNTASTGITVTNANPVVSGVTIPAGTGIACIGGNQVGLSFSFSDLGVIDNPWAVDINWGDASAHGGDSLASQGAAGPYSHTYSAGSFTPNVKVTDKDGGYGSASASAAVSFLYSTGLGILQPINYTGPRSLFKLGSTIPVKVKITDCDGNPVSTLKPQVALVKQDVTPDGTSVEDVISTVPDQGTTMRFTGSPDYQYIYNLGTKNLSAGDFKVTVSDPTIAPITAYFSIKK